jgi:hypothetical protein
MTLRAYPKTGTGSEQTRKVFHRKSLIARCQSRMALSGLLRCDVRRI